LASRLSPPKPKSAKTRNVNVYYFNLATFAALILAFAGTARADWPTYRGNAQRTGSTDGRPGPATGKVLWSMRSTDHFLASPVAEGELLYVSGLGAFNTAQFQALTTAPTAEKRQKWKKSPPYLKLPTVCSPAIAGGLMVFGDGMHQTDGAILHCLFADSGLPLWQYPVPGNLVHLEGAPAISAGKVFLGGGNAGVLCLDMNKITLEGKQVDPAGAKAILAKKWQELLDKYKEDLKKDPDFALPPSEDSLPKSQPALLWQQGKDVWHVDAPVALAGNKVLAASAYLDEEKVGERALLCLAMSDGGSAWKIRLRYNPWGGPTISGDLAIVGCSNIRFDTKELPKAKGEVVAAELAKGDIKWRREIPGGVLSPVGVKDGLAVFTATDGKLRGWNAADGEEKWTYDAGAPFFAGPALAGSTAYAADLKGVVHAVNLSDGKKLWTLDLAKDAAVMAPGMVYGSPIVHGGRLYLATCNVDSEAGGAPTAVVCIGEK
jgi:outer membrane protein assembly factor BamB